MATDTSNVVNHFPKPQDGFTTTTSGSVSSGATTVGLNSTGNYSNGDIFVGIVDPGDANKKQAFTGIVDTGGVQITGVKWTSGTDQSHASGATVVDYVSATHLGMISKGILVEHNQDGTHDEFLIQSRSATTPASGDFILISDVSDSNLLKKVTITNLFANMPNASVTADKLATGADRSYVDTSETTTSTSYTDLATTQSFSVTVGANGLLLVGLAAQLSNSGANATVMSFALSGGNTLAADDDNSTFDQTAAGKRVGVTKLLTGLTPGATTITAKFKVTAGTGTFERREIWALPL